MSRPNCPVCDSGSIRLWRDVRTDSGPYRYVCCNDCSFAFVADPVLSGVFKESSPPLSPPCHDRHRQIIRLLEAYRERTGQDAPKVLEVGSGWGGLATQLSCRGFDYLGFEPNPQRAEYCRSAGLNVVADYYCAGGEVCSADAVVLDNVLEHVREPGKLVADLVTTLKPGGQLVLIVPNRYDIRRYLPAWRQRHYWQPHCHINMFSFRSLRRLVELQACTLRPFGLGTLGKGDGKYVPKVACDLLGMRMAGLYCVAAKLEATN